MSDDKRTRRPNGTSTVYRGKDGKWHGRVTVGVRDDGRPDRRHIERRTQAEVIRAVRELEKQRDSGRVRNAGSRWTVETWLNHWVENIAAPAVRENTLAGYRVAVRVHLVPGVGAHRLEKLEPEHLENLYTRMIRKGSKPATAHQAHRTIRTALNEAIRRGHITTNAAALAKPPWLADEEVEPYTVDEVKRLLATAQAGRNSARWAVALALGLRQGEALGLRWNDVDLEAGTLWVRRSRQRPHFEHGCGGGCGRSHAGYCPQKRNVRPLTAETKSRSGRRAIAVPSALVALLREHAKEQERERERAGNLWRDEDWLFANSVGEPLNMNTDHHDWKRLLTEAGIRQGRLHDARHTAATVLLLLGVPERAVMAIMGWSNSSMATRYQHVTDTLKRDVADRMDELLWGYQPHS